LPKNMMTLAVWIAGICAVVFPCFLQGNQVSTPISLITDINLIVDEKPGGTEMRNLVPMEEGDVFSLIKITQSIRQIYRTGLFSDVQVVREGEQDIKLTYVLKRKLVVRNIDLISNAELPKRKLMGSLDAIKEEGPYSKDSLDKAVGEIEEALRRLGFFQAEIGPEVRQNPNAPQVDIVFVVRSVKRYTVGGIDFTGEMILPEREIRKMMETKEGKKFVPEELESDLELVKQSYRDIGYRRVEVLVSGRNFDEADLKVSLEIQVLPQEKIEIQVIGAEVPMTLLEPIWEVQIFEEWGLREGDAKIINYLRNKGYIFATVDSSVNHEGNVIRVIHNVSPGNRFKIQNITFEGLSYFTPDQLKDELMLAGGFPLFQKVEGARLYELPEEIELLYGSRGFSEAHVEMTFDREGNKLKPILTV